MPATVPDDVFYYIGLIAAKWTAIEVQMEMIILDVQGIPPTTGLVITASLSARQRIDLLRTFANWKKEKTGVEDQELTQLLKDIEDAYSKRNNAVHHLWAGTDDPKVATRRAIRAKGKLKQIDERVHIDDLDADAESIHGVGMRLKELAKRFDTP